MIHETNHSSTRTNLLVEVVDLDELVELEVVDLDELVELEVVDFDCCQKFQLSVREDMTPRRIKTRGAVVDKCN